MKLQAAILGRRIAFSPSAIVALIIAGTLMLSLLAGVFSGAGRNNIALLIGAGPFAIISLMFVARKFELVVLALPIAALTIPIDVPTGTFSQLPIALALTLLLCGLWIASMAIRNRFRLIPSPLNRPLLVFSVACTISLLWGFVWRDPILRMVYFNNFEIVQTASLISYLASVGAALLVGNFVSTPNRLKYVVGCFLFFGALMTLTQLLHINHGVFTDRGLWGLWTVAPAVCLLIAQPGIRWYWRGLLVALIAANLYQTMIVNLLWKSGWIPTVVAICVAVLMRSRKWFVIMVIVMAVAAFIQRDFFYQMIEAEIAEGADGRIGMWEINLRVVGDHWLFGTGPAGYAPYYMTYYPFDARSTHNNYLDIIAQFGIVGSVAWLWMALTATIEGIRLYNRAPVGFIRTLALTATSGWIAAQVSMFFGDWLLPFAYNQTITGYKYTVFSWIFLGMLISIRHILSTNTAPQTKTETVSL